MGENGEVASPAGGVLLAWLSYSSGAEGALRHNRF